MKSKFSRKEDDACIYEFLIATTWTNQGSRNVQEYANDLVNMWKQLDLYRPSNSNSLDT